MDGWYSYDYAAGVHDDAADNVMIQAKRGDDGSAWVSDAGWSVDTPETPHSVLPLVRYDRWGLKNGVVVTTPHGGEDRRGECAVFELKGDDLDLRGGIADFWVMASSVGQRWHTTTPLQIGDGTWALNTVPFDDAGWRLSWTWTPEPGRSATVDKVLADANSYGVGFVSFTDTPTGRLGLRGFHFAKC